MISIDSNSHLDFASVLYNRTKKFGIVSTSNDGFASRKFVSGTYNECNGSLIIKHMCARKVVTMQDNCGTSPVFLTRDWIPFFNAVTKCSQMYVSFSRL